MLQKSHVFSSFSVYDIPKAKAFYGSVLGIEVRDGEMGLLELHVGQGAPVIIYPKDNHEPATFTVLNFAVDNLEDMVDMLIVKGITFEQYRGDIQTDEKGICRSGGSGPDVAWFRDPAGNILSLMNHP